MSESSGLLAPLREYLAAPRCAVLSTLGADGAPRQVVVHYLPEPDGLLVNGGSDRRWAANLRRDPRASLVVHDAERPLHWVGMRGTAERVREGREATEDAMTMARRYGEDPSDYEHLERVSFLLIPSRAFEYGSDAGGALDAATP